MSPPTPPVATGRRFLRPMHLNRRKRTPYHKPGAPLLGLKRTYPRQMELSKVLTEWLQGTGRLDRALLAYVGSPKFPGHYTVPVPAHDGDCGVSSSISLPNGFRAFIEDVASSSLGRKTFAESHVAFSSVLQALWPEHFPALGYGFAVAKVTKAAWADEHAETLSPESVQQAVQLALAGPGSSDNSLLPFPVVVGPAVLQATMLPASLGDSRNHLLRCVALGHRPDGPQVKSGLRGLRWQESLEFLRKCGCELDMLLKEPGTLSEGELRQARERLRRMRAVLRPLCERLVADEGAGDATHPAVGRFMRNALAATRTSEDWLDMACGVVYAASRPESVVAFVAAEAARCESPDRPALLNASAYWGSAAALLVDPLAEAELPPAARKAKLNPRPRLPPTDAQSELQFSMLLGSALASLANRQAFDAVRLLVETYYPAPAKHAGGASAAAAADGGSSRPAGRYAPKQGGPLVHLYAAAVASLLDRSFTRCRLARLEDIEPLARQLAALVGTPGAYAESLEKEWPKDAEHAERLCAELRELGPVVEGMREASLQRELTRGAASRAHAVAALYLRVRREEAKGGPRVTDKWWAKMVSLNRKPKLGRSSDVRVMVLVSKLAWGSGIAQRRELAAELAEIVELLGGAAVREELLAEVAVAGVPGEEGVSEGILCGAAELVWMTREAFFHLQSALEGTERVKEGDVAETLSVLSAAKFLLGCATEERVLETAGQSGLLTAMERLWHGVLGTDLADGWFSNICGERAALRAAVTERAQAATKLYRAAARALVRRVRAGAASVDDAAVVAALARAISLHGAREEEDRALAALALDALAASVAKNGVVHACVRPVLIVFAGVPMLGAMRMRVMQCLEVQNQSVYDAVLALAAAHPRRLADVLHALLRLSRGPTAAPVGPASRILGDVLTHLVRRRHGGPGTPDADVDVVASLVAAALATDFQVAATFRYAAAAVVHAELTLPAGLLFGLARLAHRSARRGWVAAAARSGHDMSAPQAAAGGPSEAELVQALFGVLRLRVGPRVDDVSAAELLYLLSAAAAGGPPSEKELRRLGVPQLLKQHVLADPDDLSLREQVLLLLSCKALGCLTSEVVAAVEYIAVELLERTVQKPGEVALLLCAMAHVQHLPCKDLLNGAAAQVRKKGSARLTFPNMDIGVGYLAALSEFAVPQPLVIDTKFGQGLKNWLAYGVVGGGGQHPGAVRLDTAAMLLRALPTVQLSRAEAWEVATRVVPSLSKSIDAVVEMREFELPCHDAATSVCAIVYALLRLGKPRGGGGGSGANEEEKDVLGIRFIEEHIERFVAWQGAVLSPRQAALVLGCVLRETSGGTHPFLYPPASQRRLMKAVVDGCDGRWAPATFADLSLIERFARLLAGPRHSTWLDESKAAQAGTRVFLASLFSRLRPHTVQSVVDAAAARTTQGEALRSFAAVAVCAAVLQRATGGGSSPASEGVGSFFLENVQHWSAAEHATSAVAALWAVCVMRSVHARRAVYAAAQMLQGRLGEVAAEDVVVLLLCFALADTFPKSVIMAVEAGRVSFDKVSPLHSVLLRAALKSAGREDILPSLVQTTWETKVAAAPFSPLLGRSLFDIHPLPLEPPSPSKQHLDTYLHQLGNEIERELRAVSVVRQKRRPRVTAGTS
eukprot:Rhum_TRINITY_DN21088_c0_g1::Rhum_TRINITY_DN21088_c0_g1_i1::g.172873::m.172873